MNYKDTSQHCYDEHPALEKIHELYHFLVDHDGFGELHMDVKILKRGQKEIIISCGRQYRFVVETSDAADRDINEHRKTSKDRKEARSEK